MILLFGGTSETAALATALAQAGHKVLVSTATDAELDVGYHPLIRRRCGRLDVAAIKRLAGENNVRLVIDASHPFASQLHETLVTVIRETGLAFIRFQRQFGDYHEARNLFEVDSHEEAAALLEKLALPVLLTTGSRHLEPYVAMARKTGLPIYARILPHSESLEACDAAGLEDRYRIAERGPFTIEQNRSLIKKFGIKVMVTKDSGTRGGVDEKLEAARLESCQVVLIRRPAVYTQQHLICSDVAAVVRAVASLDR